MASSDLFGGATSAPPPTPAAHHDNIMSSSDAADALSRLLQRLPPTLSLPTRLPSPSSAAATCPPCLSLNDVLSCVSKLGYAQLTDHSVPSELANSAESEALALFDLSQDQKQSLFPKNWPLGYGNDEDEDEDGVADSFRFDSACSTESSELALFSLRKFARELEKLGLMIVDELTKDLGCENPLGDDPTRVCSVMWVSESLPGNKSGGFYPFVIGLQYQIRNQKYSLLSDSGWVSVLPHVDSILVTFGDIAQIIYVGWAPFLHNVLCSKVPMSGCVCSSFFIGMWPKVEKSSIRPRKTGRGKSLKSQMTNGVEQWQVKESER
uniref:Non-haem dioxygenase N-terminal domain-containing protein n=1 Tax=Glycine max TaxID=3847 RepID=A0A0R0L1M0_SOYBN